MHLKSLVLTGFKSFPDRTRLDFGDGVSVVVGPNGSGKSNVTDAVLWAMGEQSPLAVRGQSMQDVIFGGGRGVQPRSAAEVEIVLDNSDGTVELPLSEISIVRRLERSGEGGYRLNGARCRLTDVIEVLSDTGLGKESHSVISQGRVDSIVSSKPRERRLLIEEAAGLGKHRKRRRRAQLKLERTQENLDRALDIEREARTRLRPLKRQAEAAELHERLELQILQARLELAGDTARACTEDLALAEQAAAAARGERAKIEAALQESIERRGLAESALAERAARHDAISRRVYGARSALERLQLRAEQVTTGKQALALRIERVHQELAELRAGAPEQGEPESDAGIGRIAALEAELAEIERRREQELGHEVAELEAERERQRESSGRLRTALQEARAAREQADQHADALRGALAAAERAVQDARRESERVGAELAAANQFLRSHSRLAEEPGAASALSDELGVREGYELALAAVLGGRLDAALVSDVAGAQAILDRAGPDGGAALLAGDTGRPLPAAGAAPTPGAERILDLLEGPPAVIALASRLLSEAWVVERLEDLPDAFPGVAVTRSGRVWFGSWGEIRQVSEGGSERVLARRNQRERLIASAELAAQAEHAARQAVEGALEQVRAGELARAEAEGAVRESDRAHAEATEAERRTDWLIEQRRAAPAEGPLAVRRAQIEGELGVERRQAERLESERAQRHARIVRLNAQLEADTRATPRAERLAAALALAAQTVSSRLQVLEQELAADGQAGERMAGELRECAEQESRIQASLRACGERVTESEVAAQRLRDQAAEAELELSELATRLGLSDQGGEGESVTRPPEPLGEQEIEALRARVERLTRRREQLGPVNPLAQEEYGQALEHVEELESQRADLETALRELRSVIRETDRQIEEAFEQTFSAAAKNFEELAGDVFPGGTGRLRLVTEAHGQAPVLGGQPLDGAGDSEEAADAEAEDELSAREQDLPGVEIEITPAGKSMKRLSLLSGGEKSMTALAFLFAVFLARPCPFYILDEVEAALDDLNLERFLELLRRYSSRAQFIVITHQKRTMEAADWLYGVSMGQDGVSKVISRALPARQAGSEMAEAEVA